MIDRTPESFESAMRRIGKIGISTAKARYDYLEAEGGAVFGEFERGFAADA
jgi:hypothetical protein